MTVYSFDSIGLILFTTIFLSILLVSVTSHLAHKVGAIDIPNSRSSHATPTPRMGGLAMSLSLVIACIIYLPHDSFLLAFLSGLFVVVVTGAIDDVAEISPRWKFVGQGVAATLFVYLSGLKIEHVGDIMGLGNIELGNASGAFSVFCMVGGMNAFNLSDGLDGLAGGMAAIAAVFFGYFAWLVQGHALLIIAISLLGVIVGFLRENNYPAKVFMGDSGSLMLGYVLAVLLVALSQSAPTLPVTALAMVVTLPLLDTLLVMTRRVCHRHSPFLPDRTHLHHRLLSLHLPHPAVVVIMYGLMIIFGLLAIALKDQPDWEIFLALMGFGLLVFAGVSGLQYVGFNYDRRLYNRQIQGVSGLQHVGFSRSGKERRIGTFRQTKFFRHMAVWMRATARPIGISILVALLIPAMLAPLPVLNADKILSLFLLSGLLAVFSWKSTSAYKITSAYKGVLYGSMYLAIFALLLIYQLSATQMTSWSATYSSLVAAFAWCWAIFEWFFSKYTGIAFTSGFELLMLFVSWFVPFVVLEDLNLSAHVVHAVQHACLLSVPFFLAMKINIRIYGGHNHWIRIPLIFGLLVVAVRSWL